MTAAAPSPSIIPTGNATADYLEAVRLIQTLAYRLDRSIAMELDRHQIGLEPLAAMLLFRMGDHETTASELMTRGYYLGSNVSYSVKKLVEMGLLDYQRCATDKRSVRLKATDKGKAVANIIAVLFERQAKTLADLNALAPSNLESLTAALRKLHNFVTEQVQYWQR